MMPTEYDRISSASKHIASFLSDGTRTAYAAKPQVDDKDNPTNKEAGDKDLDRKRQIHEALALHHKSTFHRDNTSLESARRTSQILVDASKPDEDSDRKGK